MLASVTPLDHPVKNHMLIPPPSTGVLVHVILVNISLFILFSTFKLIIYLIKRKKSLHKAPPHV